MTDDRPRVDLPLPPYGPAVCVRCVSITQQPLPVGRAEVGSGPPPMQYACARCAICLAPPELLEQLADAHMGICVDCRTHGPCHWASTVLEVRVAAGVYRDRLATAELHRRLIHASVSMVAVTVVACAVALLLAELAGPSLAVAAVGAAAVTGGPLAARAVRHARRPGKKAIR